MEDDQYILYKQREQQIQELQGKIIGLEQKIQKISDRELESRARANTMEDVLEKFLDKMISGMH